jgi:hypothetical protein
MFLIVKDVTSFSCLIVHTICFSSLLSLSSFEMKRFYILWFGHLAAVIAQYFIVFCLNVWFYEISDRSFTQISLLNSLTDIPGILVVPLAGIVADHFIR